MTDHAHEWGQKVGEGEHHHSSGVQGCAVYRCECGAWAHQIIMFACGVRRKRGEPIPASYCPLVDQVAYATWWAETGQRKMDDRNAARAEAYLAL